MRFFVVGDIGKPGAAREAVARAMQNMAKQCGATDPYRFVLSTGDNFYDKPPGVACLEREMLQHLHLPWYFVLGNHDMQLVDQHLQLHKETQSGYNFRCPAHYYKLSDDWRDLEATWGALPDFLEVFMINTNKFAMKSRKAKLPKDVGWGNQKAWLASEMAASKATWKIVVGHHPIEMVKFNFLEHRVWGVKYFCSTFMKGGAKTRWSKSKRSMSDTIQDGGARLYICGHQHLVAYLEKQMHYLIVGSSAKLEQDFGDFDSDEAASSSSTSSSSDSEGVFGAMRAKVKGKREKQKKGTKEPKGQESSSPRASPRGQSIGKDGPRFWQEIAFATIDVTPTQMQVVIYGVEAGPDDPDNPQVHEIFRVDDRQSAV